MKILGLNDRVKLIYKKDDDKIEIFIKTIKMKKRLEIASLVKMVKGEEVPDYASQSVLTIQHCVDDIKGLIDSEGNEYKVEKNADDSLTEECAEEVYYFLKEIDYLSNCFFAAAREFDELKGVEYEVKPKK
jgi:hypothetical protein